MWGVAWGQRSLLSWPGLLLRYDMLFLCCHWVFKCWQVILSNDTCGYWGLLVGSNREALAVAAASGASFIRAECFVFSHVADEGWMDGCAGDLLRYRRVIGAEDVMVLTDINKKHWWACHWGSLGVRWASRVESLGVRWASRVGSLGVRWASRVGSLGVWWASRVGSLGVRWASRVGVTGGPVS